MTRARRTGVGPRNSLRTAGLELATFVLAEERHRSSSDLDLLVKEDAQIYQMVSDKCVFNMNMAVRRIARSSSINEGLQDGGVKTCVANATTHHYSTLLMPLGQTLNMMPSVDHGWESVGSDKSVFMGVPLVTLPSFLCNVLLTCDISVLNYT